jgi:ABC-type transport system involved in multi-copper enzyme maturation permease subunit
VDGWWRMTRAELFKLRRSVMRKVVILMSGVMLLLFGMAAVRTHGRLTRPIESFSPPLCSEVASAGYKIDCVNTRPSVEELRKLKAESMTQVSRTMRLPESWPFAGAVITVILALAMATVGAMHGGTEYSNGTIRLLLTRGTSRTNVIAGKVTSLGIMAAGCVAFAGALGIGLGYFFNSIWGTAPTWEFLNNTWLKYAALMFLTAVAVPLVYSLIGFTLATVGRSAAIGAGTALGWVAVEPILTLLLPGLGSKIGGAIGRVISGLPEIFPYNVGKGLLQDLVPRASGFPDQGLPAAGGPWLPFTILFGWLVACFVVSAAVTARRDVTS